MLPSVTLAPTRVLLSCHVFSSPAGAAFSNWLLNNRQSLLNADPVHICLA